MSGGVLEAAARFRVADAARRAAQMSLQMAQTAVEEARAKLEEAEHARSNAHELLLDVARRKPV